jgi:primosomal protein N' (replication factor Y)
LPPNRAVPPEPALVPTNHQAQALAAIIGSIQADRTSAYLLHGVTGSGKTEVYLQALARCLALGRSGIVLVPEISLTSQLERRFEARFPDRVAVLHSRLSTAEHRRIWWAVHHGDFDIAIGSRSALFAPLSSPGLIVLDEEHDWSYKQHEPDPRYHARAVALQMARQFNAVVVLGSATPDLVTHNRALAGRSIHLLTLPYRLGAPTQAQELSQDVMANKGKEKFPDRLDAQAQARESSQSVVAGTGKKKPSRTLRDPGPGEVVTPLHAVPAREGGKQASVTVVDMRQELREGNRSIFSRALQQSLVDTVARGDQAILFINRRGTAGVVQCRDCGQAVRCRSCDTPLTYHAAPERLVCHQCNRRSPVAQRCSNCRSQRIRYLGLGTQRVVREMEDLVPGVSILRWDRDVAEDADAPEGIVDMFADGKAQVLVGTQMVAKSLHIPAVTLVGAVLADIGLHLPDFRSGERVFQLLCQVAGRAGRGSSPGTAIVQTYRPDHYAVALAADQDYTAFYNRELEFRREQRLPPFSRLIRLLYANTNEVTAQREAQRMGRVLAHQRRSWAMSEVDVIGPAPAYPTRVRGRYRWHLLIRGPDPRLLLDRSDLPEGWVVDVDPVSVL